MTNLQPLLVRQMADAPEAKTRKRAIASFMGAAARNRGSPSAHTRLLASAASGAHFQKESKPGALQRTSIARQHHALVRRAGGWLTLTDQPDDRNPQRGTPSVVRLWLAGRSATLCVPHG